MTESGRVSSGLPELDKRDDPRGGAVAWALLTVAVALIVGIIVTLIWLS
jgi:hypothetical protein